MDKQKYKKSMKIAIMGLRGIPANYGGFETFIEEMAPRLVKLGHEVTVYGRSNIIEWDHEFYRGVKIVILPTVSHKYLDTIAHTFVCVMQSFFTRYDVVLIVNSANSVFSIIPRLMGKPTVVNVDGLEWKRQKWNVLGQGFYRISEFFATFLPTAIVTDAVEIQNYYLQKFGKKSTYIPYGAPENRVQSTKILDQYGLEPRRYILYVSRMEPENNAHLVVQAFEKVKTDMKLVMVGDAPYSTDYIRKLKSTQDKRIIFTGYVFGDGYRELQSNTYFYVQATEVGGTHPALLEGMGYGNCILANDVLEHREVVGEAGLMFTTEQEDDLANKMQYLLDHPQAVDSFRKKVVRRVHENYSWDRVTSDYEKLFARMCRNGKRGGST